MGGGLRLLLCVTPLTLCPLFGGRVCVRVCECTVSLCAVSAQGGITINRLLCLCLLSVSVVVVAVLLWDTALTSHVLLLCWPRRVPMMQRWRSCQGAHLALNALTHSDGVFLCWLPCWLSFWHWSVASEHLTLPAGLRQHVPPDRLK